MITFLYTLGIYLYLAGIRLAALWNTKARQWVQGRRQLWSQLAAFNRRLPDRQLTIWIHSASLGEFEQGRPVLEALRRRYPEAALVLTFFSPSGYEIRKNYAGADLVCYLPADTPGRARRFVRLLQPGLAVFVKYEFWHHHLRHLQRAGVPVLLISAIFRPSQLFFRWYGGWYRSLLRHFDHLFVQDDTSGQLLRSIGITNYTLAGDTRVDRVLELSAGAPAFPEVERFTGGNPVWIAGSTWPADEQLLLPFFAGHLPAHWRIILAPHDISEGRLSQIEQQSPLPTVRYSRLEQEAPTGARMLLIDNIGMLSALYRYGRIAYIGGGFGKAIHNLLEPIAFRLPVLFGPRHEKFQEAIVLKSTGGGFAVEQAGDLLRIFVHLQDETAYRRASGAAYDYLLRSRGSTDKILRHISGRFAEK